MILTETFLVEKGKVKLSQEGDGSATVITPINRGNIINVNKRMYLSTTLERAARKLKTELETHSVYGGSEHPVSGSQLELDQVSHMIKDLWMKDDILWAKAKILPTVKGRNLLTILNHGSIGTSTRGAGKTISKEDKLGKYDLVDEESYQMFGFDFVTAPSADTWATKDSVVESVNLQGEVYRAFDSESMTQVEWLQRLYQARQSGFTGTLEEYKIIVSKK